MNCVKTGFATIPTLQMQLTCAKALHYIWKHAHLMIEGERTGHIFWKPRKKKGNKDYLNNYKLSQK